MRIVQTLALVVIAGCYVANTFETYTTDDGGTNYFFGNFGYYLASN